MGSLRCFVLLFPSAIFPPNVLPIRPCSCANFQQEHDCTVCLRARSCNVLSEAFTGYLSTIVSCPSPIGTLPPPTNTNRNFKNAWSAPRPESLLYYRLDHKKTRKIEIDPPTTTTAIHRSASTTSGRTTTCARTRVQQLLIVKGRQWAGAWKMKI